MLKLLAYVKLLAHVKLLGMTSTSKCLWRQSGPATGGCLSARRNLAAIEPYNCRMQFYFRLGIYIFLGVEYEGEGGVAFATER